MDELDQRAGTHRANLPPRRSWAEQGAKPGKGLRAGAVVDPGAASLRVDETGFPQHLEVVADRRGRHVEGCDEVANAGLVLSGDEGQEAEANGIAQGLENGGQRLGLRRVKGWAGDATASCCAGVEHGHDP
mgnify:CR=1 FL=1